MVTETYKWTKNYKALKEMTNYAIWFCATKWEEEKDDFVYVKMDVVKNSSYRKINPKPLHKW